MSSPSQRAVSLHEISYQQAIDLSIQNRFAVLPIGSNEQHGPHLPTGTDSLILEHIIRGVSEKLGPDFPVFFLPLIPYGKSPEHLDFMGTVSLRATTLISILEDVVSSLSAHGIKKVIIINSHGGNASLLTSIAFDLRHAYGTSVYTLNLWGESFFDNETINSILPDLKYPEVHAASIETSLLMYLTPEWVSQVPVSETACEPFPSVPVGWSTTDLSNNGVIGDLSGASTEAGRRIYELSVEKIVTWLKDVVT